MSAMTWSDCDARQLRAVRSTTRQVSAHAAAPVRLTRRGRFAVVLVLAALAVAVLGLLTAPATASGDPATGLVAERVTVRPGETLWAIAERVRPDADPRATIARIRDMNGLESSVAQAGQVLLVPAGR